MNNTDRKLIQDKQDQLLRVTKQAMDQLGEIKRLRQVLNVIASYKSSDELREQAEEEYGLDYVEALEMAYDNIQMEALAGLGYKGNQKG